MEREDKAGKGYVDFIFYPERDRNAVGIAYDRDTKKHSCKVEVLNKNE